MYIFLFMVGLLVGLTLGGFAAQRAEAAYRARAITRAVEIELRAHGVSATHSRALVIDQAAGGFEVDSITPARVVVAESLH